MDSYYIPELIFVSKGKNFSLLMKVFEGFLNILSGYIIDLYLSQIKCTSIITILFVCKTSHETLDFTRKYR